MSWLTWLGVVAVRNIAVALTTFCVLALIRPRGSGRRLQVWTAVLGACLLMPALMTLLPGWQIRLRVLPAAAVSHARGVHAVTVAPVATPWHAPIRRDAAAPRPREQTPVWPEIALGAYLVVAFALLLRLAMGIVMAGRIYRAARPIDGMPGVLESERIRVPMTGGVWRRCVLLPSDWRRWSRGEREAVLAHERAHATRRDVLTMRLAFLHRAVFWFSPLGWWLPRQLARLAEEASDDAALAAGTDAATYAEMLVGFARHCAGQGRLRGAVIAMASSENALARVERILAWKKEETKMPTKTWVWGLTLGMVPAVLVAAAARPAISQTAAPSAAAPQIVDVKATAAAPAPTRVASARPAPAESAGSGFQYALLVGPAKGLEWTGPGNAALTQACSFTTFDEWTYVAIGDDCTVPDAAHAAAFSVIVADGTVTFTDHGRTLSREGQTANAARGEFGALDANNAKLLYLESLRLNLLAQMNAQTQRARAEAEARSERAKTLRDQAAALMEARPHASNGFDAASAMQERAIALEKQADNLDHESKSDEIQTQAAAQVADLSQRKAELDKQIDALGLEASGLTRQLERDLRQMAARAAGQ